MAKSIWHLLVAGFMLFSLSPAFGGQDDDQPAKLDVHIRDYCDPATFNAVLGPGGCARDTSPGAITFAGFLAELNADKSVGAWRFAPGSAAAEEGTTLMVENLGGETHTFTRVKKFGGGFVAALNAASGNPVPAPECAQTVNGQLVPQPPSANNIFLAPGAAVSGPRVQEGETVKFECCIHPWMRLTLNTKGHEGDESH